MKDHCLAISFYLLILSLKKKNIVRSTDMKVRFFYTETGSISIINWFAPDGKKPSHYPAKSSFPFFGVEPCLIEENPILEVCNLLIYIPRS